MIDSRKETKKKVHETKSEKLKQKHQHECSKIQKQVKRHCELTGELTYMILQKSIGSSQ
jgi:hypothetical protein